MVTQARRNLDRLYGALRDNAEVPLLDDVELPEEFMAALCDDLNTPLAITQLFLLARELNSTKLADEKKRIKSQLIKAAKLIGLLSCDVEEWFSDSAGVDVELVERLIEQRKHARAEKDFTQADAIRDQLTQLGVEIEDTQGETRWKCTR